MPKTSSVRRNHAAKMKRGGFRGGWSRRCVKVRSYGTPKLVAAIFNPRRAALDWDRSPAYPSRASRRLMRAGGMRNTATARKELAKFTDDFRRWRLRGDNLAWAIASGDARIGIVRMPEGWYVR